MRTNRATMTPTRQQARSTGCWLRPVPAGQSSLSTATRPSRGGVPGGSGGLGRTEEAPQTVEFVDGLDAEDEELLEEWCGLQCEAVDLDEWE